MFPFDLSFFRFRRLPASWMGVVVPFLLSLKMTWVVSGISTLKGIGFAEGFFARWMSAWAISWLIAFPVLLLMMPLVRRIAGVLVEPPGAASRR